MYIIHTYIYIYNKINKYHEASKKYFFINLINLSQYNYGSTLLISFLKNDLNLFYAFFLLLYYWK
jgi:hypothetical protein